MLGEAIEAQLPCVRNGRLNKGQGVIEGVTSVFRCIIMPTKGGPSPPGRWGGPQATHATNEQVK